MLSFNMLKSLCPYQTTFLLPQQFISQNLFILLKLCCNFFPNLNNKKLRLSSDLAHVIKAPAKIHIKSRLLQV